MTVADASGTTPWIEVGTIQAVDRKKFTVDWVADYSERRCYGVPIVSPVMNQSFGEGFSALPEPGAKAVLCLPSDRSSPIILGFISDPDEGDGEEDPSYRGGRKDSQGEEIVGLHGRKGQRISVFRDGTIMIQSKPGVQTVYVPSGVIHTLSPSLKVTSAAGNMEWSASETSEEAIFKGTFKSHKSDPRPSIGIRIGGDQAIEVGVSALSVDDEGRTTGLGSYSFKVSLDGTVYTYSQGSVTVISNGDMNLVVNNKTETIKGNLTLSILGSKTEQIVGTLNELAMRVAYTVGSEFLVTSPVIRLGSPAAVDPAVKGIELVKWLATHTHPGPKTPPVEHIQDLPQILSTAVFLDPR